MEFDQGKWKSSKTDKKHARDVIQNKLVPNSQFITTNLNTV